MAVIEILTVRCSVGRLWNSSKEAVARLDIGMAAIKAVTEKGNFIFFWSGWPSQWAVSPFVVDGITYHTAEQWMMV